MVRIPREDAGNRVVAMLGRRNRPREGLLISSSPPALERNADRWRVFFGLQKPRVVDHEGRHLLFGRQSSQPQWQLPLEVTHRLVPSSEPRSWQRGAHRRIAISPLHHSQLGPCPARPNPMYSLLSRLHHRREVCRVYYKPRHKPMLRWSSELLQGARCCESHGLPCGHLQRGGFYLL